MSKPTEHENRIYAALDEQKAKIKELEQENEEQARMVVEYRRTVVELRQQLAELEESYKEKLKHLQNELFDARGVIESERTIAQSRIDQAHCLEQHLAEANQRVKELEQQLAEAQRVRQNLEYEHNEVLEQLAEAKADTKRFYAGFCELHRKDGSCDLEQEYLKVKQRLSTLDGEVGMLREALIGADWIIKKLAPHEALAIVARGHKPPDEDIATGAKYRAMIDAALSSSAGQRAAMVLRAAERWAELEEKEMEEYWDACEELLAAVKDLEEAGE